MAHELYVFSARVDDDFIVPSICPVCLGEGVNFDVPKSATLKYSKFLNKITKLSPQNRVFHYHKSCYFKKIFKFTYFPVGMIFLFLIFFTRPFPHTQYALYLLLPLSIFSGIHMAISSEYEFVQDENGLHVASHKKKFIESFAECNPNTQKIDAEADK